MQNSPLDMNNLNLYQELLLTVVQSRLKMEAASARADLLLNIFLIDVEHLGSVESYIERAINHLELDLLDARDAPEHLRGATADAARAIWTYRTNPTGAADQDFRKTFDRWETVYRQAIGEEATETYMDIENARCLAEADYYVKPPLPFTSRAQPKMGNQN
ncbi:hypothetical protein [Propionivibrio sp.]|uniref:hypothetical protein n=1 Tax=Propionivibrio sp. TaxID=2212460 RepID=UPI003BF15AF1